MNNRRTPWNATLPRVALTTLLLLAPRAVHACSVCFGGQEGDTRTAFILTALFLTCLPLLIIGGSVWWLRRRFRQLALEESDGASFDTPAVDRSGG